MSVPIDKQSHFWWGWAIAATTYPFGKWQCVLLAAFLGAAKELWDRGGHGTPDRMDFFATAAGGAVGALCCGALAFVR